MPTPPPPFEPQHVLGHGFNIAMGEFAHPLSLRPLFLKAPLPWAMVDVTPLKDDPSFEISGASSSECASSLEAHAGTEFGIGTFSASISATFTREKAESVDRAFYSHWATYKRWMWAWNPDDALGQLDPALPKLDSAFVADCSGFRNGEVLHPFAFFNTWGTHYVKQAVAGGRYVQGLTTLKTAVHDQSKFVSVAQGKSGKFGANASLTLTNESSTQSYECTREVNVVGGSGRDPEAYGTADFDAWVATVSDHPTLIDFPKGGLVPISELCAKVNLGYSKRLRTALKNYINAPLHLAMFNAQGLEENHPTVELEVPAGYKILGGGVRMRKNPSSVHDVFLTASYPKTETMWSGAAKDHAGRPSTAALSAHVIAVYDPENALQVAISTTAAPQPASRGQVSAVVARSFVMTGGGAKVLGSAGGAGMLLYGSHPQEGSSNTWTGMSKDHVQADKGMLTTSAIGVRVDKPDAYGEDFPITQTLVTNITRATSHEAKSQPDATIAAAGGLLVGGGALMANWSAGNLLTSSYPQEKGTSWAAVGGDCKIIDPAVVVVYAIALSGLPKTRRNAYS